MIAAGQHPFRVLLRLFWLAGEILLAAARYFIKYPPRSKMANPAEQARWLQQTCRRTLRIFGVRVELRGDPPAGGLLVSNHLSYLDIMVISSLWPAVFVAKKDVHGWPVIGWFAGLAGTIFIERERRSHVGEINREIEAALNRGALVVLFPEATSSGGETVLPFKSALLESAVQSAQLLTAALIEYELADGNAGEEVGYWRNMTLLPHLINLLGKRSVRARLSCVRIVQPAPNRKALARQLHAEVLRLKDGHPGLLAAGQPRRAAEILHTAGAT